MAELEAEAIRLGTLTGEANDAQIKYALKVTEASFQGQIDLVEHKYGQGVDDATKLTELYVKHQRSSTIFNAKAPNQRKAVSCMRTSIRLGQWSKGGSGEPLATVFKVQTMRQNAKKDPTKAKKLDDAFNVHMKYARMQLKADRILDDSVLEKLIYKKEPNSKTTEEHYSAVRATLLKLKKGSGDMGDSCPQLDTMISLATQRIIELVKLRTTNVPAASTPAAPVAVAAAPKV